MAHILYFGDGSTSSTSGHRAHALKRLGHQVIVKDTDQKARELKHYNYLHPIHYRTGFRFVQKQLGKWLTEVLTENPKVDLIWVNGGEYFGPKCLRLLKSQGCPVILYNNDDPTGGRDGRRFDSLLQSLCHYDLCIVMREMNVSEFQRRGAKAVKRVYMSYDDVAHEPHSTIDAIPSHFKSDVVFIGSWMKKEKRDAFLLSLMKAGVSVSIWGDRWEKSPLWNKLKHAHKGHAISGRDYVSAIQGAKVCLGLLSKGNRDMHTQRSLEVPYAGGLLCAERTEEHAELYEEGREAFFWSNEQECARVCNNTPCATGRLSCTVGSNFNAIAKSQ
ncbi:MAG: glycosyltransferase family 1 protein, partial [Chitinophagaceae bacterium]